MLVFRVLKLLLIYMSIATLAGCAGFGDKDASHPQQVTTNNTVGEGEDNADNSQDQPTKREKLPDPMRKELPLKLIKGYDDATNRLNQKDVDGAIAILTELQISFPEYSGPTYRIARIYFEDRQFQQAIDAIDASLVIDPNNYYTWNLKGVILREQGAFAQAKQAYLKSIEIYPDHAQTHINMGILADIYLYDLNLALHHYQEYLQLIDNEDKTVSGWILDLNRRIDKQ